MGEWFELSPVDRVKRLLRRLADSVDGTRFAHFRSEKDALRWLFE